MTERRHPYCATCRAWEEKIAYLDKERVTRAGGANKFEIEKDLEQSKQLYTQHLAQTEEQLRTEGAPFFTSRRRERFFQDIGGGKRRLPGPSHSLGENQAVKTDARYAGSRLPPR